jgi:hypothetical protein
MTFVIRRPIRLVLVTLLVIAAGMMQADAGGENMPATTNFPWKELWRGHGPAWSPTGAPPGLTIVHSQAAWTRVIKPFGPPLDAHVDLPVDWDKDVILFVQSHEDNLGTEVHLMSLSRTGDRVSIGAALQVGPQGPSTLGVEQRPWIIASAPAAAFAGDPQVSFTIDGRELPVTHER